MNVRHIFCAIPLVLGAGLAFGSATAATTVDGEWEVDVMTEVGPCEPVQQFPMVVAKGHIGGSAASAAQTVGFIENNGTMWVRFTSAEDVVRIQGKLASATGSGTWSSGSRYCGGKWRAKKG
jgi:hypothetical protein